MCNFEKEFLISRNQRGALMHLTLNYLHDTFHFKESCLCSNYTKNLIVQAVRSIANILLNNYAKSLNNNVLNEKVCKKRKLLTFHA